MNNKDVKITAQQARDIQYTSLVARARKVFQNELLPSLAAPEVPNALDDNLLPFDQVENGMTVNILEWTYNSDDELYVYWNDETNQSTPIYKSIFATKPEFPVTFIVDPGVLGGGTSTNTLTYKVVRNSGSENSSLVTIVKVDTRPPGHGQTLPAPIPDAYEITPEFLADNNDKLGVTINAWAAAFEEGIVITPYFPAKALPQITVTAEDVVAKKVQFSIPAEVVNQAGEGLFPIYYKATSRAGYDSDDSHKVYIDILLNNLPANLLAALVPLADDGLIDMEDVNAPVVVNIPKFDNFQPNDTITVHWGSQSLAPVPVASGDFPIPVAVFRQMVIAEGNGQVDVSYVVTRGGRTFTSPTTEIEVDISTVGPVDPTPETPENEKLLPPNVVGGAGGTVNVLTPEDKGLDATITIPFYSDNVAEGQVLKSYWGKAPVTPILVGEHIITEDDITSKEFPGITVPASIVDETGNNPSLQVYYTIQASVGAEPANPVLSMAQKVRVRLSGPGGPGGLNAAEFPDINNRGWLVLENVENGANVTVPVYEEMKLGDIVAIKWISYSDTNTATQIDGTEYLSPDVVVTAVHIARGVQFKVPYDNSILPILAASPSGQGSAKVIYTVRQEGDVFTSAEATVKIDLKKPTL